MVENEVPSIAEVLALKDILASSIDGIQLSEETAIGNYPVECVQFVRDMEEHG